MAGRIKTWIWIIVGIIVFGIVCVVAMAGAGFYYFSQHVNAQAATPAKATAQFDQIKTQFKEQRPLIELDERGHFLRSNPDRPTPTTSKKPEQLYVLAFDPDDERLVKVSIPFWLLRFRSRGAHVDVGGGRLDLEDLKLTIEDLERFGPTLIVDHKTTGGERVLVWSQ
jgi:hypothetical protein